MISKVCEHNVISMRLLHIFDDGSTNVKSTISGFKLFHTSIRLRFLMTSVKTLVLLSITPEQRLPVVNKCENVIVNVTIICNYNGHK